MGRPNDATSEPHNRVIRRARPDDWPRLRAIQAASLSSAWPDLLELAVERRAVGTPRSQSVLQWSTSEPPAGAHALVAAVASTRVGYALVLGGENSNAFTLVELAVASDHRRRGHGSALLDAVLALADDREVRLTTRADDQRAREFYATRGFRVRERLPEHYHGDPGVLLVRTPDANVKSND